MKTEEFIKEYKSVSNRYFEMSDKADRIHKSNLKLAKETLPIIKESILKLFESGFCFAGEWIFIEDGGKSMGEFYQLNSLGDPLNKSEVNFEKYPKVICRKKDLDIRWVEDRILDRYFGYYTPKYELLENELGIKLCTEKEKI